MSKSLLLQITCELTKKVHFSIIGPKALNLLSYLTFSKAFYIQEAEEYYAFLLDQTCPCVPSEVIDQGHKISAPFDAHVLSSPDTSEWIRLSLLQLQLHSLGKEASVAS